jgi:Ca2+-transporting ATPase
MMETAKGNNSYNLSVDEVEQLLETDGRTALSNEEAKQRFIHDGANGFEKKKPESLLSKFLEQFKSFMIFVLLVAAIISGMVGYMNVRRTFGRNGSGL